MGRLKRGGHKTNISPNHESKIGSLMKWKTLSPHLPIFHPKGEGGWVEVWACMVHSEIFPSGKLNYSVLSPPFPFWDSPPPTLKLPTCKGYVGICRESNIWFFALEKQLERRERKAMTAGAWLRFPHTHSLSPPPHPRVGSGVVQSARLLGGGWGDAGMLPAGLGSLPGPGGWRPRAAEM